MATEFSISGHALLSAKAAKLDPDKALPAQVALAADLLDLDGLDLSGGAKKKAERALTLQVNYQVEAGVNAAVYFSRQVGDKDSDYANSPLLPFTGIDPRAESIAASLKRGVEAEEDDESWDVLSSLR